MWLIGVPFVILFSWQIFQQSVVAQNPASKLCGATGGGVTLVEDLREEHELTFEWYVVPDDETDFVDQNCTVVISIDHVDSDTYTFYGDTFGNCTFDDLEAGVLYAVTIYIGVGVFDDTTEARTYPESPDSVSCHSSTHDAILVTITPGNGTTHGYNVTYTGVDGMSIGSNTTVDKLYYITGLEANTIYIIYVSSISGQLTSRTNASCNSTTTPIDGTSSTVQTTDAQSTTIQSTNRESSTTPIQPGTTSVDETNTSATVKTSDAPITTIQSTGGDSSTTPGDSAPTSDVDPTTESNSGKEGSTAVIVGIAVGCAALIAGIIVTTVMCIKRRKHPKSSDKTGPPSRSSRESPDNVNNVPDYDLTQLVDNHQYASHDQIHSRKDRNRDNDPLDTELVDNPEYEGFSNDVIKRIHDDNVTEMVENDTYVGMDDVTEVKAEEKVKKPVPVPKPLHIWTKPKTERTDFVFDDANPYQNETDNVQNGHDGLKRTIDQFEKSKDKQYRLKLPPKAEEPERNKPKLVRVPGPATGALYTLVDKPLRRKTDHDNPAFEPAELNAVSTTPAYGTSSDASAIMNTQNGLGYGHENKIATSGYETVSELGHSTESMPIFKVV